MELYFYKKDGKWYVRIYSTNFDLPAILELNIAEAIENEVDKFNERKIKQNINK